MQTQDLLENLKILGIIQEYSRTGSREICTPAPTDTDEDWAVLAETGTFDTCEELERLGWEGYARYIKAEDSRPKEESKFQSWKKSDQNIILTESKDFYDKFVLSTFVAKKLNVCNKDDRINLFEAILYGKINENRNKAKCNYSYP